MCAALLFVVLAAACSVESEPVSDSATSDSTTPDRDPASTDTDSTDPDSTDLDSTDLDSRPASDASSADTDVAAAEWMVALVIPANAADRGWSQSMVDSLTAMEDRGAIAGVTIREEVGLDASTSDVFIELVDQGHDLIIAHGTIYGGILAQTAVEFPEVAFAWGHADQTFDLPNVSAYRAEAEQGAYVLGTVAARLIGDGSIAAVGPADIGDDGAFVNGVFLGVAASGADIDIAVQFTESYSDLDAAGDAGQLFIDNGIDVLASTSAIAPGLIDVAQQNDVFTIGNQVNNTDLNPTGMIGVQVYDWSAVLQPILDAIPRGELGGTASSLTLANGGLRIEWSDTVSLDPEIRREADELIDGVSAGTIATDVDALSG